MQIDVKESYVVTLSNAELRIIGLALAQKLKDKEDIEHANALNEALLKQKAAQLNDRLKSTLKAQAKEKPGTDSTPAPG